MRIFRIIFVIPFIMIAVMNPSITTVFGEDISNDERLEVQAKAGFLDLQAVDHIEGNQMIPLQGEWEFYWRQLLGPDDVRQGGLEPSYIHVPSSWGNQPIGTDIDDRYGYGTYRIEFKVPIEDIGESKAIYIKSIGNAYRIWMNGEEKSGLGVVGTSVEEETPQAHINLIFLEPKQERVEMIIQVSNYSFREGGINSEIVYGDAKSLIVYLLKGMFNDIFIIGGFALIGLYHLIIYILRKRNKLTLFVGLLTLAISARTLILNGYLSSLVLGIDSWEVLIKLEYIAENIGFLFIVLLMKHMYPKEVHRYMVHISYAIAASLSLFVLVTPARIYTETMLLQTSLKAVILLYFVFYVGVVAFVHKREGAFINLAAVFVMIAAIVNDMLYYGRLVNTIEMFNYSAIIFVLAQAIIVSYRYGRLSSRNDALVVELGDMNATLEQKVELRTQKLHEANEQLSEMKTYRTKMLANIAHDLNSPLTGVQTYLHLMDKGMFPVDHKDITRLLVERTDYIQRLIRDLFELSKLETKEQSFEFEQVIAKDWLTQVYNQFVGDLTQSNITLEHGQWQTVMENAEVMVSIDRFRMMQVLHNYIDNAIKFSRDRSNGITIIMNGYIKEREGQPQADFVVEIIDYGAGITEDQLPHIFGRFYSRREGNEGGSGLGLAIVAEIIEQHQGTVGVRSEVGKGSTFYFTLPII